MFLSPISGRRAFGDILSHFIGRHQVSIAKVKKKRKGAEVDISALQESQLLFTSLRNI